MFRGSWTGAVSAAVLAVVLGAPACGLAYSGEACREWGSRVGVAVRVDGALAPLYPAPDGSGRAYLEAREGARYEITVTNRTAERVGVLLAVDGLNVVSGDREVVPGGEPGRLYVLNPWEDATVRGWRTSLDDVRRFRFVEERASYAARSGKANGKMGWIEVSVYRERGRPWREARRYDPPRPYQDGAADRQAEEPADAGAPARQEAPPATVPPAAAARPAPRDQAETKSGSARSYPGTGWGERTHDPVSIVDFEPEARPVECVTLRYEYAPALRALGILPARWPYRDRLTEREHGQDGFAQPPRW